MSDDVKRGSSLVESLCFRIDEITEERDRLRPKVDFLEGVLRKAHRAFEQHYDTDAQRIVKHALEVIDDW